MSFLFVKVYHGPCYTFHTLKHKPQRLAGLKDQLLRLGFRVELVRVDHINYCMIEMCGHDVFRCKLSNLKFNTHYDRDPVCQRAVEAIIDASEKFKQSRCHLLLWALVDDQIFMRGPFAPKDYWPTDIEVKPYVPLQQCLDCCNINVKKKKEIETKGK